MYTTILVLMVIAAILLILVVLIQNPKGGGLSGEFGGATSQMFGVQRSGDLMEQLTWGFFAFILVGALTSGIFLDKSGTATDDGLNVEKAQARPAAAPATTPAAPTTAPANGTGTSQPAK